MHKNTFDQYLRSKTTTENEWLKVVMQLGNTCTYDCSYCHEGSKSGSMPWVDIETAIKAVEEIFAVYKNPPFNKTKFHFELLGGEVTIWRELGILLKKINELGGEVSFMTNASRSLRWWEEFSPYIDYVSISFHPEFADTEHTVNVGNLLAERNIPVVFQVVMLPELWQKSLDTIEYAVTHGKFKKVTTTKLTLKDKHKNRLGIYNWPYTDEQTEWFKHNSSFDVPQRIKIKHDTYQSGMNYWVNSSTGESLEQSSKLAIATRENNWKDWYCYIGIDTLFLDADGMVNPASACGISPFKGNWRTDISSVEWPSEPVVCPFNGCHCGTDVEARKFKNIPIQVI